MLNTHFNECYVFKDSDKKCKIRTMCAYSMFKSMSHAEVTLSSVLLERRLRKKSDKDENNQTCITIVFHEIMLSDF